MIITLSPVRSDAILTISRLGDVLTVNGTSFDFSPITEGAALPATAVGCDWLVGHVTRQAGALHLTLLLPHGPVTDPGSPATLAVTFPAPLVLTGDGPVVLPVLPDVAGGAA